MDSMPICFIALSASMMEVATVEPGWYILISSSTVKLGMDSC